MEQAIVTEGEDTAHLDMALAFTPSVQELADPELVKEHIAHHIELHRRLGPDRVLYILTRESWVTDEYKEVAESHGEDVAVLPFREGDVESVAVWF